MKKYMEKNINQTSFAIAGAAALMMGLAGNVQAVSIPINNARAAGTSSWVLGQDQHGNVLVLGQIVLGKEIAHFVDSACSSQTSASPSATKSVSVPAQAAVAHNNSGQPNLSQGSPGAPTLTTKPVTQGPNLPGLSAPLPSRSVPTLTLAPVRSAAVSESVPDGGTTAVMLGGVFCGFVFLKRNSKPAQAA